MPLPLLVSFLMCWAHWLLSRTIHPRKPKLCLQRLCDPWGPLAGEVGPRLMGSEPPPLPPTCNQSRKCHPLHRLSSWEAPLQGPNSDAGSDAYLPHGPWGNLCSHPAASFSSPVNWRDYQSCFEGCCKDGRGLCRGSWHFVGWMGATEAGLGSCVPPTLGVHVSLRLQHVLGKSSEPAAGQVSMVSSLMGFR